MVNTQLFKTTPGALAPAADAVNQSGARAYGYKSRHHLAQLAATGCMTSTFYADASSQLEDALALAQDVDTAFLAKTAVYARQAGPHEGHAGAAGGRAGATRHRAAAPVFGRVIDNGKMLRNFVQILRSGATGRKSLGIAPEEAGAAMAGDRERRSACCRRPSGTSPSLADVVKHGPPEAGGRLARGVLFALADRPPVRRRGAAARDLAYERFARAAVRHDGGRDGGRSAGGAVPDADGAAAERRRSGRASRRKARGRWCAMNLNTFARHGVFDAARHGRAAGGAAARSAEPSRRPRVLPYQLMTAYQCRRRTCRRRCATRCRMRWKPRSGNVPAIEGRVVVCPDVSGSMSLAGDRLPRFRLDLGGALHRRGGPGGRGGASARTRAAAVMPFEQRRGESAAERARLGDDQRDEAGGHRRWRYQLLSAPLAQLNRRNARRRTWVIFVSDNESWVDARRGGATRDDDAVDGVQGHATRTRSWCASTSSRRLDAGGRSASDVMNVGGFSDAVFRMVGDFAAGATEVGHWVREIERVALEPQRMIERRQSTVTGCCRRGDDARNGIDASPWFESRRPSREA